MIRSRYDPQISDLSVADRQRRLHDHGSSASIAPDGSDLLLDHTVGTYRHVGVSEFLEDALVDTSVQGFVPELSMHS